MARILFRADGNSQIGAGHIMRCMSIALAAIDMGHQCRFCMADNAFADILSLNRIEYSVLGTDYTCMDREWPKLRKEIEKFTPDRIVVDSYFVTREYLTYIGELAETIYIDDVLDFSYPVSKVINYNLFATKEGYNKLYNDEAMPELIIGGEFAPLRKEFQGLKYKAPAKKISNVLISAGGADAERILLGFVREIQKTEERSVRYSLLVGSFEPDIQEIMEISKTRTDIVVYQNVSAVAELMRGCDVAISAAGSTLYELCACGVPTITYVLADNQENGARIMHEQQIMINGGDYRTNPNLCSNIFEMLDSLSRNYKDREAMTKKAASFIDGRGAIRLVDEILK